MDRVLDEWTDGNDHWRIVADISQDRHSLTLHLDRDANGARYATIVVNLLPSRLGRWLFGSPDKRIARAIADLRDRTVMRREQIRAGEAAFARYLDAPKKEQRKGGHSPLPPPPLPPDPPSLKRKDFPADAFPTLGDYSCGMGGAESRLLAVVCQSCDVAQDLSAAFLPEADRESFPLERLVKAFLVQHAGHTLSVWPEERVRALYGARAAHSTPERGGGDE